MTQNRGRELVLFLSLGNQRDLYGFCVKLVCRRCLVVFFVRLVLTTTDVTVRMDSAKQRTSHQEKRVSSSSIDSEFFSRWQCLLFEIVLLGRRTDGGIHSGL